MTPGGWVLMILSVGGSTAFFAWCLYTVLSTPESTRHLRSQAEIETPDTRE